MDFRRLNIKSIPTSIARQLVSEWHYSKVMPKLTKQCYGGFIDGRLLAVITLGWGVRPFHTINKLFPGLDTKDYWEIGKMCLHDGLPRNSESYFMSRVFKLVKKTYPEKKLIYTWADGIMGKPGYVYQAANFLYGGYIWTDTYMTSKGEKIHPRTSQAIINRFSDTGKQARPTWKQINELDIRHVRGKQFRYCLFLRDKKSLLDISTVSWTKEYPKDKDLEWKQKKSPGMWDSIEQPIFSQEYDYNHVREDSIGTQRLLL